MHSRRTEPIQRPAKAFIRGACGAVGVISMTNTACNGFSVTVPAWKKPVASRLQAWARRKARQVPSRRVDGGTRLARRMLRMAGAASA